MIAPADLATSLAVGEIIVDLFAGGGGASSGIEEALGQNVAVAVNHNPAAIEMHSRNHPMTRHYCESVFDVSPTEATAGRRVGLLWASPDCTHFSRAKGGKPRDGKIRGLAWVIVTWATAVAPRVICMENVAEFLTWGPLLPDGQPDPARAGETFAEFIAQLRALGYAVEWKVLCAADYGAPTIRKRLFLVARRDGQPIVWPTPTHGQGRANAWRPAADCIDWSLSCPSIFDRKRPLAPATCRRIAAGIVRYVLQGKPYLITCNHGRDHFRGQGLDVPLTTVTKEKSHALVLPTLATLRGTQATHLHGESIEDPLRTVSAGGSHHALVSAFLAKHYTGVVGSDLRAPLGTATAIDHHSLVAAHLTTIDHQSNPNGSTDAVDPLSTITSKNRHAAVAAFLVQYYSSGGQHSRASDPLPTVVSRARHGLVLVPIDGVDYVLADIGLRMLEPRELARAQGFADDYTLTGNKAEQIARIGNSVCPPVAAALVRAQFARPRRLVAA